MSDPQPAASAASDPRALYSRSLGLARSQKEADLVEFRRFLGEESYFTALDSAEAYRGPAERLRIAGVLQALAKNDVPPARRVLVSLTTDSVFLAARPRTVLLIQVLAVVRPPPPAVTSFWDAHCEPQDGYSNYTIRAVIENGTPEALTILEKNLKDPRHENDREAWLLFDVLTHRNDVALLESSNRMLTSSLDEHLRLLLVDVLFDYRPDDWYGPHLIPKPPPRDEASRAALEQLRRVATTALSIPAITSRQGKRIAEVLQEIRSRLDRH